MNAFSNLYKSKLTTADHAVAKIADSSNVVLSMGVSQPPALMTALAERVRNGSLSHLPLYYMHGSEGMEKTLFDPSLMDVIWPRPLFMSAHDRQFSQIGHQPP